jgi:hypothetical protein
MSHKSIGLHDLLFREFYFFASLSINLLHQRIDYKQELWIVFNIVGPITELIQNKFYAFHKFSKTCLFQKILHFQGTRGSLVVKALYKPEGRGYETRWGEILHLPNPSGRTRSWGLLSL